MNAVSYEGWIAVIALAAVIILLAMLIGLWAKMRSLQKRLANMTAGTDGESLEGVLTGIQANLRRMDAGLEEHGRRLSQLEKRVSGMKGRVALHRYNAFDGRGGGDLSFSLAIVDDAQNGAVITAIHGRDETLVFGKPVTGGRSDYKLTPEEREAIDRAMGKSEN